MLLFGNPKRRKQARVALNHFDGWDARYAQAMDPSTDVLAFLRVQVATECHVMSDSLELDGREMPLDEAVRACENFSFASVLCCFLGNSRSSSTRSQHLEHACSCVLRRYRITAIGFAAPLFLLPYANIYANHRSLRIRLVLQLAPRFFLFVALLFLLQLVQVFFVRLEFKRLAIVFCASSQLPASA